MFVKIRKKLIATLAIVLAVVYLFNHLNLPNDNPELPDSRLIIIVLSAVQHTDEYGHTISEILFVSRVCLRSGGTIPVVTRNFGG